MNEFKKITWVFISSRDSHCSWNPLLVSNSTSYSSPAWCNMASSFSCTRQGLPLERLLDISLTPDPYFWGLTAALRERWEQTDWYLNTQVMTTCCYFQAHNTLNQHELWRKLSPAKPLTSEVPEHNMKWGRNRWESIRIMLSLNYCAVLLRSGERCWNTRWVARSGNMPCHLTWSRRHRWCCTLNCTGKHAWCTPTHRSYDHHQEVLFRRGRSRGAARQ